MSFHWTITRSVLDDVFEERLRQHLKWGEQNHPDGIGGAGRETYEAIAKQSCERAARDGRVTYAHIFEEEAAEVLAARNPQDLRTELIQVAAVCCAWVEKLSREGAI